MKVKIKYIKSNGKKYTSIDEMTIKKAKEQFNKYLKDDKEVIEVYLLHFDMWNYRRVRTLKGGNNG